MSRKSNKVLRDLSELGNEFDINKLESEIVNEKVEDKGRVDIKMNENKPVEKAETKEVVKEVQNITLEQLKSELIYNKDSLFKGIQMYFDKRLDYTQKQIKNLDEKLEVLLNKEEGLKRVCELEEKLNKLQEILKM